MKKIFILFGIAAFSSASAQQKEPFDIQKHLLQKAAENKKTADYQKLFLPFNKPFTFIGPNQSIGAERSYLLPNGDKVVTLSLDNMPCVQPGMSQFYAMPNVAKADPFSYDFLHPRKPGQIPNGAMPFTVISK